MLAIAFSSVGSRKKLSKEGDTTCHCEEPWATKQSLGGYWKRRLIYFEIASLRSQWPLWLCFWLS